MTHPAPERINYAETLDFPTKRIILFGTLLGLFLAALDQTIVSTALPKVIADLQGIDLYSWVTTAYLLTSTAMVPIYGKLSDIYGRKPILLVGITVFLLGSVLCGAAGEAFLGNLFGGGMMQLIVFRGVQGLGAAALTSVAFSIIADIFAPADRAKYQGLFGAVFGLSSVIGPLLGGFLTDNISWRWVFYVNVPIGLLALAFIATRMPRLASGLKPKIDYLGALMIVVFSVPLLLALTLGADKTYGWGNTLVLGLFALSVAALIAFLFAERRHESPIIPLTLFQNPTFRWGVIARFMIGAAFLGAILFLSLYLVQVQGVSATAAGTATIPLTVGLIIGSVVSGQIASRIGHYKPLILTGLVVMIFGFWWLSTLSADTPYGLVIVRMIILGLGIGPALPLYNLALQNAVKPYEIGVATSAGQFFQQMGSTIGTAVFGALLTAGLTANLSTQFRAQAQGQPQAVADTLVKAADSVKNSTDSASQERGQTPKTTAQIKADFDALRANVTKAIRDNDPKAIAALKANKDLPASMTSRLGGPSIADQVRSGFQQTYATIAGAVNSGNAQALAGVAANPQLPAELRTRLSQIPPQALRSPQARAQILSGIQQGLNAAQGQATQAATDAALKSALQGVDTGEKVTLAVARASKVAFADTIASIYRAAILVAVLALLATLMMPNLRLETRSPGERRAPAHVEI
ncbi:DHA2 family efflux MFS transporter permease subunit [Deinococcus maricopensis]|uniref:Drug resistance transporter, EmrB/QacA subfamily n=1 Tax=Deinococcus maricopensis (strain DSM 21211 / LMG 22137 / NRRL B-23946 / LB-34) TaxID=709986 RepID=E8U7W1_DEIML|nr:DHA2 family efflux MFS transporter permease subunit [Deinococcus maricopensis]ADV67150.1 drug resistance transporter, EmrB/QacA subfamily [Deinococcus maricopensis DSM 21211]